MLQDIIAYLGEHWGEFGDAVIRHILLSVTSLAAACLIAIPLGILCAKKKRLCGPLISILTILRVIPSIGLLILILPLVETGFISTCFALTVLALPMISIHTYGGYSEIPPSILEAAEGMGLSKGQVFRKIKTPLALPQIFTGIRSASVDIISSATVAALMGSGGLGQYVFVGMQINSYTQLLIGGISVAAIALVNEVILWFLQKESIGNRLHG